MYELTYIVKSNLSDIDLSQLAKKIQDSIIQSGGEINKGFTGQKRRFSYPIKKEKEGYYLSGDFQVSADNLSSLENQLKAEKDILRYLIITKKIVKLKPPKIKAKVKPEEKIKKVKLEELDKKIEEILEE